MSPCSRSGRCRRGANSQSRQVLNHRVVGGNFLNQSEVNVSGNDAARGIRPSNVRRTDSRSHGKVSYTPARHLSPWVLNSDPSLPHLDGITMHSMGTTALLDAP